MLRPVAITCVTRHDGHGVALAHHVELGLHEHAGRAVHVPVHEAVPDVGEGLGSGADNSRLGILAKTLGWGHGAEGHAHGVVREGLVLGAPQQVAGGASVDVVARDRHR